MKITKQRLKEIIKEELNEAWSDPFSEAKGIIFNLVDELKHDERMGRETPHFEELKKVLELLVQHQNDMKAPPQEE